LPIAERYFMCHSKAVLQQASWHPGSPFDAHLMTLTSDNTLRLFNLDLEQEKAEETIRLSEGPVAPALFGRSALTVKGSLGETAVGFDFAPPTISTSVSAGEEPSTNPTIYPVFILWGDGRIFFVATTIGQKIQPAKSRNVMGPLPMLPESDDNYGSDACALLCLHPVISSPPILVIATSSGTLYHCIVLPKSDEADVETSSQVSGASSLASPPVDMELFVFEQVELELSLLSSNEPSQRPFDYPLLLSTDPLSPSRYFCSHKAGVHSINLPMVAQLAELAQSPDDLVSKGHLPSPIEQNSIIQHLVCTQLFSKNLAAPVQGLSVSFPPAKLHCILQDFKVVSIPLSKSMMISDARPLLCTDADSSNAAAISGSGGSQGKESFDKHIALILQRTTTNPLMKASANMSSEESYEILARCTKVFREEYMPKLDKARREIEKRVAGLEERKTQQHLSLAKLTEERFELRDSAAQLSEKYEDLRDNEGNLVARIEAVLNAIQRRLPVTTDAEIRMQRQLQSIDRKNKDLTNALEQIKAKERYQSRQINVKTKNETMSNYNKVNMGPNQVENMKDILRQDGEQISTITKRLQSLKKDLM